MATTKLQAIKSLIPMAAMVMKDDVIIKWDGPGTQPTDSQIAAEQTRLDNLYTAEKYKRDREAEYPSIADQLDDIYHNGIDAWKATIKTTKDKYPKP
jgi:hypothetical protein